MDPQGRPDGVPVNIDLNQWNLVLRDGVPTLVPRGNPEQLNQAALVRMNGVQNGNNLVQSNNMITQASYEQALALDFSNQNTPLTNEQHAFLRTRLETLRGTLDQLENKIDNRRRLTMNYEGQGANASSSGAANSIQTRQGFTQPQQNTSYSSHQVFYNNGAQNIASSASRQGDYRNYQQGTSSSLPAQSNNAGSSSRNYGIAANVPSIPGHQRQASAQGLAEQRRQIFQQAQQSYMGMNQAPNPTPAPQSSQANLSRSVPNVSLSDVQNIQLQRMAQTQAQAGVRHTNLSEEDYKNLWLASSQTNSHQVPNQPSNSFPKAHIPPASVHSTPQQPSHPNATASPSNIHYPPKRIAQPQQQPTRNNAPVTVSIPPAPTRTPATSYDNLVRTLASSMSSGGRMPPTTSGQHLQPVAAPMVVPLPMASMAPRRPAATFAPPPQPTRPLQPPPEPIASNEVAVKEEPEEELSLAQSILQHYGKRKEMDSAGTPEPASKRRAVDSNIASEMPPPPQDLPMQDGWTAGVQSGLGDINGLENEFSAMEDFVDPNFQGLGFRDPNTQDTATPSRVTTGDVAMLSEEVDAVHSQSTPKPLPHISTVASIQEHPRSDPIDDFPRVEMLSDEMNVPDSSRSPSAARLSSVSESDPLEPAAPNDTADEVHREEAEVEGAILMDAHTDEHQRTPVPELKSASPLISPSDPSESGIRPVDGAASMLRSPSIPLFPSVDKGKRRAASRSRSPSLPLFLPMPSSGSSSDAEVLARSSKKEKGTSIGPMIYPRRRFLGVNVPFVPGLSRKRLHKMAQKFPRRRKPLLIESSSSEEESSALFPDAVDVNGHGIDPYSSLKRSLCLWTGCGAVLDSQMKLMKHVEAVHASPHPPGPESQTLSRCRWGNCRKQRSSTGASNKLLRHLIKHIGPVMTCMADGCPFTIETRDSDSIQIFLQHWDDAHKDDPNLKLKPSTFPEIPPPEPSQELPEFVPASEALFLPVYGDPGATFRSRPPSPRTPSQATSVMPLSPTKNSRSRASRARDEKRMDEYSFLDPFYPPNLIIEDLAQNAMELFDVECRGMYIGNIIEDRERGSSDEP